MPIHSPWPSLRPYPTEPAWAGLERQARRVPDKPALIEADGPTSTYSDLWRASLGVACFFQREMNLQAGERVAIAAHSSREFVATMYGAWLAGGVVTPLSPTHRVHEIAHQLGSARPALVLAEEGQAWDAEQLWLTGEMNELRAVLRLSEVWGIARDHPSSPHPIGPGPGRDLALLPYSSGTSGLPKGVRLTHANLVAATRQLGATELVGEGSTILNHRLFWHVVRLVLAVGATCISQAWMDPEQALRLIETHRATHLLVRPSFLGSLVEAQEAHRRKTDWLQLIETAAEPLAPAVAAKSVRLFGCPVAQAYHLTETSGSATRGRPGHLSAAAVGWPVADTELAIVDDRGADVGPGEDGELLVRGPQVMQGYWEDAAATVNALLPGEWLRTGDIARANPSGRIEIVARMKDLIKVRGLPVAPGEIEAVLLEHPAVKEAVVVPIRWEGHGEAPKAFVLLRDGALVTTDELIALVAGRLAPQKALREVEFVPSLPRNAAGKMLRQRLTERRRSGGSPSSG